MRDKLFSVEDKVVLITGGSGGIGSELIKGFHDRGAVVANFDVASPSGYGELAEWISVDLASHEEIDMAWSIFMDKFATIDVLINCAGITCPDESLEYPHELWKKTLDCNLYAPFYLTQLAGQQMIKHHVAGSIINITSINAAVAMPNNPSYAAAKAGLRHLTKSFALDWGKYGIRVNNIGPGYTETKINTVSLNDPEKYKKRAELSMLGRWAEPKEMVGPAIFLASDASSFVTGTDLWVDGGWISKGM